MSSSWHQKKNKLRQEQEDRDEQNRPEDTFVKNQTSSAAMGGGEDNLFEKKLSKEEKKAAAKAAREAKKKNKQKKKGESVEETKESGWDEAARLVKQAKALKLEGDEKKNESLDALAAEGTICTFSESKKGVDSRSRDINVQNFTLAHKGHLMLDETEIVLNHGNRYGLIGRNGCGKSTLMKALGVRAVPIPAIIDQFHLKEEIEPSKTLTAIDAVMSVDEERNRLEKEAETLNSAISALAKAEAEGGLNEENGTMEEQQEEIMNFLSIIYDRLDALDSSTAESRARGILKGLGFTHAMQGKVTADFSGGWRMRVSLARALFIQPTLMLLDEPTNHLDMEAVIWLEDYLSKWDKILFLVSHSQDFLNNVCTHIVDFTHKGKLVTYDGNYDQFIKTKREKEENQMKQYKWEQDQIKNMKDYVARFGHGTSKNAKQAQSKEKVLEKMVRAGLTEKPTVEKPMNFKFPDPSNLPPPVLSFRDVSFGYPNCEPLYSNVNLAVDLDSRVALVGPNGAGKTTLVKLMSGQLQPSMGDIRPHLHLKLGRFTQHFIDVLDLSITPLEFFTREYPDDSREEVRSYLGRFGISGQMQIQKTHELSDGQKSRVVFAKLARDRPHILLLDEPTNHLDMESIDALAVAIQAYGGGLVLVSHDMRLISQVANEIWICDHKTVMPYKGDIQNFKMDMRAQMGIGKLKGDASVVKSGAGKEKTQRAAKKPTVSAVVPPKRKVPEPRAPEPKVPIPRASEDACWGSDDEVDVVSAIPKPLPNMAEPAADCWGSDDETETTQTTQTTQTSFSTASTAKPAARRYVPPHLR